MKPTILPLMLILAALFVAACDDGDEDHTRGISATGPTESGGVVVESTTLRSEAFTTENNVKVETCEVRGIVRNDTATDRKATLIFTAFDHDGNVLGCLLGTCTTTVEVVVRAGRRSSYSGMLGLFLHCDSVARLEITELRSEPVA